MGYLIPPIPFEERTCRALKYGLTGRLPLCSKLFLGRGRGVRGRPRVSYSDPQAWFPSYSPYGPFSSLRGEKAPQTHGGNLKGSKSNPRRRAGDCRPRRTLKPDNSIDSKLQARATRVRARTPGTDQASHISGGLGSRGFG